MTPASIRLSVRQYFQTSSLKPHCQSNFIGDSLGWRDESYSNDLKMHLSPLGLGFCQFLGGDSLVVDLLLNVLLIMGVLCLSLFLVCITLRPS